MKNRIRELRKARGLTMKQLGAALGVAESTVSQYETGKRNPDNETLLKLSELFGVTVGFILYAEDHPQTAEAAAPVTDDDIKFALFGGAGEITDEMYDEVKKFAAFVKSREWEKKKKG